MDKIFNTIKKSDIEYKHPEYECKFSQWERCRDAIEGADAVKGKETIYLPKLPEQDVLSYERYLKRALWFNASARTLKGLKGLVLLKPINISEVSGNEEFVDDADMQGKSFATFIERVLEEVIGIGRYGILIDHPQAAADTEQSQADAEKDGYRPYLSGYRAEVITNWVLSRVNNHMALTRVVLVEDFEEAEEEDEKKQYRELVLQRVTDEKGIQSWAYSQNIWRWDKQTKKFQIVETIVPLMNGKALDFIPFYFAGVEDGTTECSKPPMLDLVDLNYSHFRTMADLEHGRFFCGLPTPIFAGFNLEPGTVLKLGGTAGLMPQDPTAKAYFLEFTGSGLLCLENAAAHKESMMARMGARILREEKTGVEAAETLKIQASSENSVLTSIAKAVSAVMTKVYQAVAEWGTMGADALVTLNSDFSITSMTAQELTSLLAAVVAGKMPLEDFFEALKKGGIIAEDRIFDDFEAELPSDSMGLWTKAPGDPTLKDATFPVKKENVPPDASAN
jgi:hypothetical protein